MVGDNNKMRRCKQKCYLKRSCRYLCDYTETMIDQSERTKEERAACRLNCNGLQLTGKLTTFPNRTLKTRL